jgi:hypothetical protein
MAVDVFGGFKAAGAVRARNGVGVGFEVATGGWGC